MFVTRAHHEAVVDRLEQAVDRLEQTLERETARADRLEAYAQHLGASMLEMKHAGFEKAPAAAVLPPRKADPVQDAIALAAKNDAALRRHLGAFARAARAEGTTDDEIVAKVLHWEEDAEGD